MFWAIEKTQSFCILGITAAVFRLPLGAKGLVLQ